MPASDTASSRKREVLDESDDFSSLEHTSVEKRISPGQQQVVEKTGSGSDESTNPKQLQGNSEDVQYPGGFKLFLLALALCLSIFLVALDSTIIATAVPKITDQFHSLNDVGWYGSAYLLTTAAFQLVFGKFYTFYSIKWVFLIAVAIFEVGSLICGVAPNSVALIIGRAIAGLGSAGIFSGAYLIIATSVPLARRPTFTGLIGGMYGIASVVGPLLGGAFTVNISWRWCFYINLPIGGIAVAVILFFFKPVTQESQLTSLTWKKRVQQFDILGTTFFLPGVVCLLVALQLGGSTYSWSSGRIIALLVVFGICMLAFIGVQFWRPEYATVRPDMLKKRSIWAAGCFTLAMGSAFFVAIYYLPIWFQVVKDASAYQSGIRNIPILLSVVVGTILSGALVSKIGYYTPFMLVSSVLTSIGAGLLLTFEPSTGHSAWIGYQVILGFGIGLGLQLPLIAVQTVLDMSEIPIATATMIFLQLFGASVFVSVSNSVLTNKLIAYISQNVPGVSAAAAARAGATNIRDMIPPEYLHGVIQTYNDALTDVFEIILVMACLTSIGSVAMEWESVKGKQTEMTAA